MFNYSLSSDSIYLIYARKLFAAVICMRRSQSGSYFIDNKTNCVLEYREKQTVTKQSVHTMLSSQAQVISLEGYVLIAQREQK
jgi:hypothetical protein